MEPTRDWVQTRAAEARTLDRSLWYEVIVVRVEEVDGVGGKQENDSIRSRRGDAKGDA
jgi:hypothetical protein